MFSSDESYLVMKVRMVKEVKRSDGLWRFACGDVLGLTCIFWVFRRIYFRILCIFPSFAELYVFFSGFQCIFQSIFTKFSTKIKWGPFCTREFVRIFCDLSNLFKKIDIWSIFLSFAWKKARTGFLGSRCFRLWSQYLKLFWWTLANTESETSRLVHYFEGLYINCPVY